jgi:hypothetical protein
MSRSAENKERSNLLTSIKESQAEFKNAVMVVKLSGQEIPAPAQELIANVTVELESLLTSAEAVPAAEFEAVANHANALARFRAYLLPVAHLKAEANLVYGELRDWKIPGEVLMDIKKIVDELQPSESPDRAMFERVLAEYDYWASYIDWWSSWTAKISEKLLMIATAALIVASVCLLFGWLVLGFIMAGITGTAVSILLKLPPLSVYGEYTSLTSRILSRFAAGMAGTVVGCGLIAFGVFDLNGKGQSVAEMLSSPTVATPSAEPAAKRTTPEKNTADTGRGCPGCRVWTWLRTYDYAPSRVVAILLSLGVLLGFSERSLSSFEDIIFRNHQGQTGSVGKGSSA